MEAGGTEPPVGGDPPAEPGQGFLADHRPTGEVEHRLECDLHLGAGDEVDDIWSFGQPGVILRCDGQAREQCGRRPQGADLALELVPTAGLLQVAAGADQVQPGRGHEEYDVLDHEAGPGGRVMLAEAGGPQDSNDRSQQQRSAHPAPRSAVAVGDPVPPPQGGAEPDRAGGQGQQLAEPGHAYPFGLHQGEGIGRVADPDQGQEGHDEQPDAVAHQRAGQRHDREDEEPAQRERSCHAQIALARSPTRDGRVQAAEQLDEQQDAEGSGGPSEPTVLGHGRLDHEQVRAGQREQSADAVEEPESDGGWSGGREDDQPRRPDRGRSTHQQQQHRGAADPGLRWLRRQGPPTRTSDQARRHRTSLLSPSQSASPCHARRPLGGTFED